MMFRSPHQESYERFLSNLPRRFKQWLEETLQKLYNERIVDFKPCIAVYGLEKLPSVYSEIFCIEAGIDYSQDLFLEYSIEANQGRRRIYLGRIPILRENGSFIINGRERAVVAQLTWSPGLFMTEELVKGEYLNEMVIRPEKGVWIKFELSHEWRLEKDLEYSEGDFPIKSYIFKYKPKRVVFGNLLKSFGFKENDLKDLFQGFPEFEEAFKKTGQGVFWSEEYLRYPHEKYRATFIPRLLNISKSKTEKLSDDEVWSFNEKKLISENYLGELGRWQVNRKLKRLPECEHYNETSLNLTRKDVILALRYLMHKVSGTGPRILVDDHWDLSNLKCRLIGDFLEGYLQMFFFKLGIGMKKRIDRYRERHGHPPDADTVVALIEEVNRTWEDIDTGEEILKGIEEVESEKEPLFSEKIRRFFTTSALSRAILDDNVLTAVGLTRRVTYGGEGGIEIEHSRTPRAIHWSHYGRICPLDTPQSDEVGITLSLTPHARVNHLGIVETPYFKVEWKDGNCQISDRYEFLSSQEEEELVNKDIWIAYADQRAKLQRGKKAFAHRREQHYVEVDCEKIGYIDIARDQQLSFAARLIPFIQCNEGVRATMACSMIRQALPLKSVELPLVGTGFEKTIIENGGFGLGNTQDGAMAYGVNLLTMYIPWKGYNFEDAIVISESAKDKLISVERYKVCINKVEDFGTEKIKKYRKILGELKKIDPKFFDRYGENGVIQEGEYVQEGDLLVLEFIPKKPEELLLNYIDSSFGVLFNSYYALRKGKEGIVKKVEIMKLNSRYAISILIERERIPQIGDKLANRHGHKGVISKILPDHEMPYFIDPIQGHNHKDLNDQNHKHYEERSHTHAEILINPLGVISRMNLGQLYETHWGWVVKRQGAQRKIIEPFGGVEIEDLRQGLTETMEPLEKNTNFKIKTYDPTGRIPQIDSEVTVGYSYIMRLDHNAEEKEHARSKELFSYSYLSQQPLRGKARKGGQRFGEMEVWALMAHNTPRLLQEMMTLKSDNPEGRQELYEELLEIFSNPKGISPSLPDVLYTFSVFCLAMGINLIFYGRSGKSFSLLDGKQGIDPESIVGVEFRLLSDREVLKWSYGFVNDPTDGNKYVARGIFSQEVFGPIRDYTCQCRKYKDLKPITESLLRREKERVSILPEGFICEVCKTPLIKSEMRRRRIGHIELFSPVINILFFPYVAMLLGITESELKAILKDHPRFNFHTIEEAELFLRIAHSASEDLKNGLREKTGGKDDVEEILNCFKGYSEFPNTIGGVIARVLEEKHISGVKFVADILGYLGGNLNNILDELKRIINGFSQSDSKTYQERASKIVPRYTIIRSLKDRNQQPTQFLIKFLPVIPPGLRPLYRSGRGEYLGDLNDHYIRIIRQNNRLEKFLHTPVFFKEELRRLQENVNAFIWNEMTWKKAFTWHGRRPLKAVAGFFEGKKGFFKENLLGKRVDYSARAVIVPDPEGLKINECGISLKIMLKMFKPILVRKLQVSFLTQGKQMSIHSIMKILDDLAKGDRDHLGKIQEIVNSLRYEYPVILNRQPTLHKLSMLAFYPDLRDGAVFFIHPLITGGYNADFDGDQMAAYLPLTKDAREDVKRLLGSDNIFKPADGSLALNLSQDISLGIYYLTLLDPEEFKKRFSIETKGVLDKKSLQEFLGKYLAELSPEGKIEAIETLKKEAFKWATKSGLSYSVFDFLNLSKVEEENGKALSTVSTPYKDKPITLAIDSGARGDRDILNQIAGHEKGGNLIVGRTIGYFFERSIASRGNLVDTKLGTAEAGQLTKQLVQMAQNISITARDCGSSRGIPISKWQRVCMITKAESLQSFNSSTDERVKDPEYFTKDENGNLKQVDFSVINTLSPKEIVYSVLYRETKQLDLIRNRLYGRILAENVPNYSKNTLIGEEESKALSELIFADETISISIRSPITCVEGNGVCQFCYGLDLGRGRPKTFTSDWLIGLNENIGIVAAHSISEPATQMALRKKHGRQEEDTISDFYKARRFFEGSDPSIACGDPLAMLDAIEGIYREAGIIISSIHFEIIIKTMQNQHESLLAKASFKNEVKNLARWAVEGEIDYLIGLKEKVMLGKRLHNYF